MCRWVLGEYNAALYFVIGIHMFKKVIFVFFLGFSSFGCTTDLSFKEKSPADRLYNENYQGIDTLQEEQKFKFDPKLKIAQKDQSYQYLLEQRDEEQKSIYNELWNDSNRLFVQADGKPMHPSTISKWFVRYVGQIRLPVINFHGLRHTNASLLVAQNVDIAVISARLGHAQISTTLDFYVHPLLSHNRKAGYALENLLLPARS